MMDASYGINIPDYRKEVLASYFNEDGSIKDEITIQKLEILNQKALSDLERLRIARTDAKATFLANLKKHFLHELLTKRQEKDQTMLAGSSDVGGIDIQNIDVKRTGAGAEIEFNDDAVRDILKNGFNGFTPVIINITPVVSPLVILGLAAPDGTPKVNTISAADLPVGRELEPAGV
jgi:hypothetical protein